MQPSDLLAYRALEDAARDLALRWVKAWPREAGYPQARDVARVCVQIGVPRPERHVMEPPKADVISFWAYPDSCCIGIASEMPTSYLLDSSTLETDAVAWYRGDSARRSAKWEREKQLKETPDVAEYLRLTQMPQISI